MLPFFLCTFDEALRSYRPQTKGRCSEVEGETFLKEPVETIAAFGEASHLHGGEQSRVKTQLLTGH